MIFFDFFLHLKKKLAIDSSKREDKPIFMEKMNFKNELGQYNHSFLKSLEYQESDSRIYSDNPPSELCFASLYAWKRLSL